MACYEDGGSMTLRDVGRLTRSDFLTRWDGWPVDGLLRIWRSSAPAWCRTSDEVRLSDQMRGLTCRWLVTKMAGLWPCVMQETWRRPITQINILTMKGIRGWRVYTAIWYSISGDWLPFWPDGMDDLSMTCYEDVGAMPMCDVGRLANIRPFWPDGMDDLSMTCYEDVGAMPMCNVGRLANQPEGMPPCRDAMPRVFSPLGFNINFTLNTWFWTRIYRIFRIKEDVFISDVKVIWRRLSLRVVSWCSTSHNGIALPSSN